MFQQILYNFVIHKTLIEKYNKPLENKAKKTLAVKKSDTLKTKTTTKTKKEETTNTILVEKTSKKTTSKDVSITNLSKAIIQAMQDVKANDIVSMDLTLIPDAFTKKFIICHADNVVQVGAIAQNIISEVRTSYKLKPYHHEGMTNREWIIIDYLDVVVHVFYREARTYYELEKFWNDAKISKHDYKK